GRAQQRRAAETENLNNNAPAEPLQRLDGHFPTMESTMSEQSSSTLSQTKIQSPAVAIRDAMTHEIDPAVLRAHLQDPRAIVRDAAARRMRALGIPEVEPVTERYWLPEGADPNERQTCPRCGREGVVVTDFGYRRMTRSG